MQKYWGTILAMLVLASCGSDGKIVENTPVEEPKIQPIVTHFGFNLENFNVVRDTIKKGQTFGELMLKNKVDYPKIVHIAENYRDTFDVRRMDRKPYVLLKSKDTAEAAQVFIYQNDKINYTVFDFRDSTANVYKGKKKVTYLEHEVAGTIKNSLSMDLDSLGVDYSVTINLSEVYAWTIDFFRFKNGYT
ncbi:MAG: hypothetical protein AAGH81_14350 [Bacteroidota bacterium]